MNQFAHERKKIKIKIKIKKKMGLPGFEPGLEDSESSVLAITPQALIYLLCVHPFTIMWSKPSAGFDHQCFTAVTMSIISL